MAKNRGTIIVWQKNDERWEATNPRPLAMADD